MSEPPLAELNAEKATVLETARRFLRPKARATTTSPTTGAWPEQTAPRPSRPSDRGTFCSATGL